MLKKILKNKLKKFTDEKMSEKELYQIYQRNLFLRTQMENEIKLWYVFIFLFFYIFIFF